MDHKNRTRVSQLDFRNSDTKYATHVFHKYPAVMVGPVAKYCLNTWLKNQNKILDPFVGSGSVLVESAIQQKMSIGVDLNPLAVLISKVKTRIISLEILLEYKKNLFSSLDLYLHNTILINSLQIEIPDTITNWDQWFSDLHLQQLLLIKSKILEIVPVQEYQEFFLVAFSELIREASYTRNGEFKRFRMPKDKRDQFLFPVLSEFLKKVDRNIQGYRDYLNLLPKQASKFEPKVYFGNSKHLDFIEDASMNGILTSPPYGDSFTTVAYGQFSSLSSEILGLNVIQPLRVDDYLMGGKKEQRSTNISKIPSPHLHETLDIIREKDGRRVIDVERFFQDYFEVIQECNRVLKENSKIVFVVGNRTVKNTWIETDIITSEIFSDFGYKLNGISIRDIPNKSMPSKNSPSNIKGDKVTTMVNEFIVVMER
ncbi:MAG: site-specific DNA-methyltransferase [Candidatus Heimdallarchaeota archaeon]|nr:site-specific DNA-methyltransferase [Candidatus Heimdallarchaeota archaeon]